MDTCVDGPSTEEGDSMGKKTMFAFMGVVAGALVGGVFMGRSFAEGAEAPTQPLHRYQYKCVTDIEGRIFKKEALEVLNREGAAGWRLLDGLNVGAGLGGNHLSASDQYCFVREY